MNIHLYNLNTLRAQWVWIIEGPLYHHKYAAHVITYYTQIYTAEYNAYSCHWNQIVLISTANIPDFNLNNVFCIIVLKICNFLTNSLNIVKEYTDTSNKGEPIPLFYRYHFYWHLQYTDTEVRLFADNNADSYLYKSF